MTKTDPPLSVAVLAGGQSRRMGMDKALIEFEGDPLVVHVADGLKPISDDVFIVCKRPLDVETGYPEVIDELDAQTPLSGIITALYTAKHPIVFVCGCDMPFISNDVVRRLAAGIGDAPAIVPRYDDHLQPMHSVWSKDAATQLEDLYAEGQRAVHRALEALEARVMEFDDERTFVNINTKRELEAIQPPTKREPSRWKLSGD